MSKKVLNVALLLTFVCITLSSVAVVKRPNRNDTFLIIHSPKNVYSVRLKGRQDRPKLPFVNHEVVFSLTKDGNAVLTNEGLHVGDWFDPSFDILYPQHRWLAENLVHFYREQYFNDGERESITIQNKTKQVIKYIRVTSVDLFLMFDVQPGTRSTLIVSAPRADNRWISVEGKFQDGRRIEPNGVGFLFPKGKDGPFAYYVYINEDGFAIESPDLEKYKGTN